MRRLPLVAALLVAFAGPAGAQLLEAMGRLDADMGETARRAAPADWLPKAMRTAAIQCALPTLSKLSPDQTRTLVESPRGQALATLRGLLAADDAAAFEKCRDDWARPRIGVGKIRDLNAAVARSVDAEAKRPDSAVFARLPQADRPLWGTCLRNALTGLRRQDKLVFALAAPDETEAAVWKFASPGTPANETRRTAVTRCVALVRGEAKPAAEGGEAAAGGDALPKDYAAALAVFIGPKAQYVPWRDTYYRQAFERIEGRWLNASASFGAGTPLDAAAAARGCAAGPSEIARPADRSIRLRRVVRGVEVATTYTALGGNRFAVSVDPETYAAAIYGRGDAPDLQDKRLGAMSIIETSVMLFRPSADILVVAGPSSLPTIYARCPASAASATP